MSSTVEYEASNAVAPVKNSNAVKAIAVLQVTAASQVQDLDQLFGGIVDDGHFISLAADMPDNTGARVYVAFGFQSGSIDRLATMVATQACWPVFDGSYMPVRIPGGSERLATGIGAATNVRYNLLHYQGSATGFLRLYLSSLGPGQNTKAFPPP